MYHRKYISRLLHKLGWSVQKPDLQAMERNEALAQAWLRQDCPRIKKARRLGAEIVFEDEFGMFYTEPVSFTWASAAKEPDCRYEVIPNAGHTALMDNSTAFNTVMLDFLKDKS